MKTTKSINEVIREYKEYLQLKEEIEEAMAELKKEAIEYMSEEDIDEVVTAEGKITYRDVISNRFASSEFKKIHADLYKAFTKQTTTKRFTCN